MSYTRRLVLTAVRALRRARLLAGSALASVLRRATATASENRWPDAPDFARAWRRAHRWPV